MKKLLLLLIIASIATCAVGQTKPKVENEKKLDSLVFTSNPIQVEKLNTIQNKLAAEQAAFNEILELIFGHKMEEIETWYFNGKEFIVKLKQKK